MAALRARRPHVPFRDSQLTRLLQPALGPGATAVLLLQVGSGVGLGAWGLGRGAEPWEAGLHARHRPLRSCPPVLHPCRSPPGPRILVRPCAPSSLPSEWVKWSWAQPGAAQPRARGHPPPSALTHHSQGLPALPRHPPVDPQVLAQTVAPSWPLHPRRTCHCSPAQGALGGASAGRGSKVPTSLHNPQSCAYPTTGPARSVRSGEMIPPAPTLSPFAVISTQQGIPEPREGGRPWSGQVVTSQSCQQKSDSASQNVVGSFTIYLPCYHHQNPSRFPTPYPSSPKRCYLLTVEGRQDFSHH